MLRETKTSYNRRMLLLFTKDYGKISAGTSLGERGKTKSSLALQHFTYGRYSIHQTRNSFNVDSAEVIRSFYRIGEDVDKYMHGAYVLEFTAKVLEEGVPMPGAFRLLVEFFDVLEGREKGFGTIVLAYQVRLFRYLGVAPELNRCAACGRPAERWFSVTDGGLLCDECREKANTEKEQNSERDALIYNIDFGIINAFRYFNSHSLKSLENIALNGDSGRQLQKIVRAYAAYHLDASNIKSEGMI